MPTTSDQPPAQTASRLEPPCLEVACAVIWRQGRILLARRADSGLWELPGGKARPGEALPACLEREIAEELGVTVEVLAPCGSVRERGQGRALNLHAFVCRLAQGEPQALEHRELRWVALQEMADHDLCPADRQLAAIFAARPPLPAPERGGA
jgi:8-oxo-dGTP diphosphatase